MNWFGVSITLLYIFIVLSIRWDSLHTLKTIPLNEFGDFFAGVFGPLMLFWLILGFIQQQKELKQNTKALELQAKELNRSVKQHKELVKATKQQAETDLKSLQIEQEKSKREVEPNINFSNTGWSSRSGAEVDYVFIIVNSGKAASNIKFTTIPAIERINNYQKILYLGEGERHELRWSTRNSEPPPEDLSFSIHYQDANKDKHEKHFSLKIDTEYRYEVLS